MRESTALQSIIIHVFITAGQILKLDEIIFESKGAPWCFGLAYSAYREDRLWSRDWPEEYVLFGLGF